MMLTGKASFNEVIVKQIIIEKENKSSLIIPNSKGDDAEKSEQITDFPDHPFQGEVVGVGEQVTLCKVGDTVLFKVSRNWMPTPYLLNDKGTTYFIYNQGDIALVREPIDEYIQSAATANVEGVLEVED